MPTHSYFTSSFRLRHGALALGLLALLGCQEEEGVKRYQVARPVEPAKPAKPISYTTPKDWKNAPLAPFSIATFQVSDGENKASITITPPEQAKGSLLDNVNRWRTQMKHAPFRQEDEARKELKHVEVGGHKAYAVDLTGPEGPMQDRLLGVIVDRDSKFWFFRMRGPAALVEKQKPAFFDEFIPSVKFGGD